MFKRIFGLLPNLLKRRFYVLYIASMSTVALEAASVGAIAMLVAGMTDPEAIFNLPAVKHLAPYLPQLIGSSKSLVVSLSLVTLVLLGLKNTSQLILEYYLSKYTGRIDSSFGDLVLRALLAMPCTWHSKQNSSDLIQAVGWRTFFGSQIVRSALTLLSDSTLCLLLLCVLFVVEPVTTSIAILLLGSASVAIHHLVKKRLDSIALSVREKKLSSARIVMRSLQGVKDVKVFSRGGKFISSFQGEVEDLAVLNAKVRMMTQVPFKVLEASGFLLIVISLFLMLFVLDYGWPRVVGTIALLVVAAWRLLPAVGRILSGVTAIRNSLPYLGSVLGLLDGMPRDAQGASASEDIVEDDSATMQFNEEIVLDGIDLRYPGAAKLALDGVSFRLPKGMTLGIVGDSGAGKSSLVDLLLGLIDPDGGKVLVDGISLHDEKHSGWKGLVGYVPQSPYIFDGTLADNVAFRVSNEAIDTEKVKMCCKQAAMAFVDALPKKELTMVGERGAQLSGGQAQRIAIARALYNRPELLVFDEATSSLDGPTEQEIMETIYGLKGNLTMVIVAHRLSTIERCDNVVWLKDGRVEQYGTSAEVLKAYRQDSA